MPIAFWQVLETIRSQADQANSYDTSSIAGDAVELLLDKLDPERVIATSISRLSSFSARNSPGWMGWGVRNGKPNFTNKFAEWQKHRSPRRFCSPAHAIWRLDQSDAAAVAHDNPVELKIAPLLLRLGHGIPSIQNLAMSLGGSTVDQLERRQQRGVVSFVFA